MGCLTTLCLSRAYQKSLIEGSTKWPRLLFSNEISFAFCIFTGTSASSSKSKSFSPNCPSAHSLNFLFVPSCQSGLVCVNLFPEKGGVSKLIKVLKRSWCRKSQGTTYWKVWTFWPSKNATRQRTTAPLENFHSSNFFLISLGSFVFALLKRIDWWNLDIQ